MKTIFRIVIALFLINSVMISSEYAWVQKTLIVDNPDFQMRTKSAVKDELNIISISKSDKYEYFINVIINGEENKQLKSNLDVILEDKINWENLQMLYNKVNDLFYIFIKKNIVVLDVTTKEISTVPFSNSISKLKHFGSEYFYVSSSIYDEGVINSRITKFKIGNNNVSSESFLSVESDKFRLIEFAFSTENEILAYSEGSNEAFIVPKIDFYDEKRIDREGLDFYADYVKDVFPIGQSTSGFLYGLHNLDTDTWVISCQSKGYYISYDDAITWKFIPNPYLIGGDQEMFGIPRTNKYLLAFGYGKNSYTNITNSLEDVGTPAKILTSNLTETNFGDGYHKPNMSIGSDKEIYTYGQDGWIYKLESVELTSVEDSENLVNIRIDPNPVNDILHLRTNSDILIESLTIYDLLGNRLIQQSVNGSNNNLKINCTTLMTGTYVIVAQTKNGNIINKFIKQ